MAARIFTPRPIAPDAPPTIPDDELAAWPRVMMRQAIGRYHSAREILAAANRVAEVRPDLSHWRALAVRQAVFVERHLLDAILCTDPTLDDADEDAPATVLRHARGVASGGRLYLAVPDDDHEGVDPETWIRPDWCDGRQRVMQLAVVEQSRILGVD